MIDDGLKKKNGGVKEASKQGGNEQMINQSMTL